MAGLLGSKLMFPKRDKHYPNRSGQTSLDIHSNNKFRQTCYKDLFRAQYALATLPYAPLHEHASRGATELLVKHSRNLAAAALEDAASAEEPFVRVCREVLKGKQRGCGARKRKPSAKIFESINKMLGQIVLQKQS